jgi:hypothetical protein
MSMRRPMPPAPRVYSDDPSLTVARVVLGVTLRLDAPLAWAQGLAAQVFREFAARAPAGSLRCFASSARDGWQSINDHDLDRIASELDLPWHLARLRHPVRIRVADAPGAGERLFHYCELDPARGGGSGYLQLFAPADDPPDDLLALCLELANAGPFTHGVAGYHASWNRRDAATSFGCLLPWCRRYAGLHVEDPDAIAPIAAQGLAAVNWVTLLGEGFVAERPELAALLADAPWRGAVRTLRARHGALIVAGEAPTLGDLNTLKFPNEYAEVAATLAPWTLPSPGVQFRGWARKPDETAAWHRRLLDLDAWQAVIAD